MSPRSNGTDALEALARLEVPPMEPQAVDRIEADLLDRMTSQAGVLHVNQDGPPPQTQPRRWRSALTLAAAAAILVFALVVSDPQPEGLELLGADQVVLVAPDGTSRSPIPGERLPDGTTIRIRPGGWALLGATRLGPGEYQIDDGKAVRTGSAPVPDRAPTASTEAPTPNDSRELDQPDPTALLEEQRDRTVRPPAPPAQRRPSATTTPQRESPAATAPAFRPTSPREPEPADPPATSTPPLRGSETTTSAPARTSTTTPATSTSLPARR